LSVSERILVLASRGRDAQVIERLLIADGRSCAVCGTVAALASELESGAGTAVVTEESLVGQGRAALTAWLGSQPSWSDFPFILLATKRLGRRPEEALDTLHGLGNVVVLERPIHGETLASAVGSALRGRRRQYEAQHRLDELKAAEARLTQLNDTLEARISERTGELSLANNLLMQEVAERERAQAALAQAQKMEAVGQLTGGIAHDFNNLLTVVQGNLELIQLRANDEKIERLSGFALQAADRAAKLTSQLLAFSRTQRLSLKPVSLNLLINGMNDLLTRTIGTRISIEMALDPADPWVMADGNQLELALLNLAINARDAMPDGGRLTISSASKTQDFRGLPPGPYGVVTISDTGSGIPARLLEKVFDPFFTTKPVGKGTGLGLSQVYGITRQSGGTVHIDSVEGEGASVEIWLPAATAVAEDAPKLDVGALPETRRAKILVIDDDDGVRQLIVECLEMLDYEIIEAAGGVEGLSLLTAERPDLMIVDYAMPGMSGVEVFQKARAVAPDIPILLATGYADMAAVAAVMDADKVLKKPFRIEALDKAVRAALATEDFVDA
jgi:signal transduction histidine kinase/CheY-like chemotaxis protein